MKSLFSALTKKEVPFREAPSYSRRRRGAQSTLAAPRVLLRSNSDNNLNVNNAPEWSAASASLHRSLSPQLVQQMQNNPNGTVKTIGSYAQVPRSRSPSLNRLGEDAKRQQHRHISPGANKETVSVLDYQGPKRKLYSALPGRHFIVVKPYQPQGEGEIPLIKGDRIRVLSIGEGGFWEGNARGHIGWFPAECVEEVQPKPGDGRPETRTDRTKKLFRHYTVGSYDSFDASSDCIIEEKTVVLQKKDNEGFGFVLRGAKADTPIEEFNPTPAFPALQYLESVDEDGVAWQAGLRTGDFLIEVNNENVIKVGHRQVVNMIRHGGNHLVLKVVTVTRNLDPDDTARKKAPPPPKRAPTTALSLRSKSMTSELEELAVDKGLTATDMESSPGPYQRLKGRICHYWARSISWNQNPTTTQYQALHVRVSLLGRISHYWRRSIAKQKQSLMEKNHHFPHSQALLDSISPDWAWLAKISHYWLVLGRISH